MLHPKTIPAISYVSITDFFEWVCPSILFETTELCIKLGGRYAFDVIGTGQWIIDLGNAVIEQGFNQTADVRMRVSSEDCEQLLKGNADLQTWVNSGRIVVDGDIGSLVNLSTIFAPWGAAEREPEEIPATRNSADTKS